MDVYHEFFELICEAYAKYQAQLFSISNLDTIKQNVLVEKQNPNDLFQQSTGAYYNYTIPNPWHLLINPRKDIVEWALKNFDFKSQLNVQNELGLVEDRQAIPELKELIFQSLHPPINQ